MMMTTTTDHHLDDIKNYNNGNNNNNNNTNIVVAFQGTLEEILNWKYNKNGNEDDPLAFGRTTTALSIATKNKEEEDGAQQLQQHHHHRTRTTAVLSFVDNSYLPVLSLWLKHYNALKVNENSRIVWLFALSESTYETLTSMFQRNDSCKSKVVLIRPDQYIGVTKKARSMLWLHRVMVLKQLLDSFPNLDFVLTDLDAVWIKDPQPLFDDAAAVAAPSSSSAPDVVASQADYPQRCKLLQQAGVQFEDRGGSAVFGFIFFRNTPGTRNLMSLLVDDVTVHNPSKRDTYDDQFEFNCYLYHNYKLVSASQPFRIVADANADNSNANKNANTSNDGSFLLEYIEKDATKNGRGTSHNYNNHNNISVRMLTGRQVIRYCGRIGNEYRNMNETYVVHCYNRKRDWKTIYKLLKSNGIEVPPPPPSSLL